MSWTEIAHLLGTSQVLKTYLLKILRVREASLTLPDGARIFVDLSQLPELFNNILHIYHYMDYAFTPEAIPKPGWRVIDAGAYVGLYTLWSANRVGSGGKVIALEPHPQNLSLLRRNVELNGLRNIVILPYALSGQDGEAILYSPKYRALASLKREHAEYFRGEVVEEHEVECVSLKTLLSIIGYDEVDLLKLDVEGLEYDILRHSAEVLSRIRRIVVEVHLNACSIPKLDKLLRESGYNTVIKLDTRAENQAFIVAVRRKLPH